MNDKLTPWFPAEIKPVREGVHNASVAQDPTSYRYWNGQWWSITKRSPEKARAARTKKSVANLHAMVEWRGLASKP